MTPGTPPQARLEWLKANQPNNLEAIAALERRLGVHGSGRAPTTARQGAIPSCKAKSPDGGSLGMDVDTDFYTRLKALHA